MILKRRSKLSSMVATSMVTIMFASSGILTIFSNNIVYADTNVAKIHSNSAKLRNVMYYGDWSIWGGQGQFMPKDIPADQLTHLNFAFLDFDSEGNLQFTDKQAAVGADVGDGVGWDNPNSGILMALQQLKATNPNLKTGISLGGWSKSGDFSEIADNPSKRAKFIENVLKFIDYTNMDFVDVDWEYPSDVRQPDKVDNKMMKGLQVQNLRIKKIT